MALDFKETFHRCELRPGIQRIGLDPSPCPAGKTPNAEHPSKT
jgi:hypothetical protein